jgi:hypothetical protein
VTIDTNSVLSIFKKKEENILIVFTTEMINISGDRYACPGLNIAQDIHPCMFNFLCDNLKYF